MKRRCSWSVFASFLAALGASRAGAHAVAETACEVTRQSLRDGASSTWRWSWNESEGVLRSTDETWTLRFDNERRLVEDARAFARQRIEYAYDSNAVTARRVYQDGRLVPALSFEQRATSLSTSRFVESQGRAADGRERIEQVTYDVDEKVVDVVEGDATTSFAYTNGAVLGRVKRPNGATLTCTHDEVGALASCVEDGTFDFASPGEGAAADGTPDVSWTMSRACRSLDGIATAAWLSLPVVAPLSECLASLPPWRSADRCLAAAPAP